MNSLLYTGAQVFATSENMASARQSLLELCSAVQSPAQMCIVDSTDDGRGNIETKVFMKEGFALKSNNQQVTTVQPVEGGNIYTVVSKMTEDVNYLNLSFEANGTTYKYTQLLGGKVTNNAPNDLSSSFIKNNATVTATVVDKATIGGQGSTLKLEIGSTVNKTQRIEFRSDVLREINANTKKGVFTIYNPGDEDVELSVNLTFEKSPLLSEYARVTLKAKQYTMVELNFSNVTWGKMGSVKEAYLVLGATKNENEKILFVDGFSLYNK